MKKSTWIILLIIYSLIVSGFCFKYWYIDYRSAEDKIFNIEWSSDYKELIMVFKTTGKIGHKLTDANFDQNFEKSTGYSKEGRVLTEYNDLNEDSFYEETFLYNLKGEPIGTQFDRDNNGILEEVNVILENKDTLKLVDHNKNGFMEIKKF